MTNRLPTPGGDSGDWGDILNSFLEVSLASDGTLNSNVVGTNQLQSNAVTNTQLDIPTQTTLSAVASKYTKPGSGIPATDLTTAVQTNLTSASTSIQPNTTLSGGDLSGTIAIPVVAKINGITMPSGSPNTGQVIQATSASATNWATVSSTTVSDATSSAKGIIQLDGDLGGTAASPDVLTVLSGQTPITSDTTLTGGDLTGTLPNPTVAKLQGTTLSTPSGGATSYLNATGAWTTPSGSTNASSIDGVAVTGTPSSGQVITASSGTAAAWTTPAAGAGNATSSSPGIIQLDGDLGGSATSPSVAKVNGVTLPASAPSSGNVLTATSASATAWTTPAAGVSLDSTNTDIQPLGSQSAGSSSLAAKADHVHPTTGLVTTTTSLSGDVTGTASTTTVAKVNGVAVTGTPSSGQVITASSSTAAAWTTPASGGAQTLTSTAIKTSAYTASPGDFIPVDTSGGNVTITLPSSPANNTRVEIKMVNTTVNPNNGYGNNIVIFSTGGSDVLNKASGNTTGYLTILNQAVMLQYTASSGIWYVQSDDLPQSSISLGISHTVTTTYTMTTTDHVIMADATSAAFTITLPTAIGFNGVYNIEAITSTTNTVTVNTTSSQTIEGASTTNLGTNASGALYSAVTLVSDGANWRIL
jgi:hypothetical protein